MRWAYSGYCALAHLFKGDFEAAIRWSDDATRFTHCLYWPYAHKAAALAHIGRTDEARRTVGMLMQRRQDFSIDFARRKLFLVTSHLVVYLAGAVIAAARRPERWSSRDDCGGH